MSEMKIEIGTNEPAKSPPAKSGGYGSGGGGASGLHGHMSFAVPDEPAKQRFCTCCGEKLDEFALKHGLLTCLTGPPGQFDPQTGRPAAAQDVNNNNSIGDKTATSPAAPRPPKYRVGDRVQIAGGGMGEIIGLWEGCVWLRRIRDGRPTSDLPVTLPFDRIELVPAPRPIEVGDFVTWGSGMYTYEVLKIFNGQAVVLNEEGNGGAGTVCIEKLSDLTRIDDEVRT